MFKVAVIAGTPVDTRMGVDFIEKMNGRLAAQSAKASEAAGDPGAKGSVAPEAGAGDLLAVPVYLPVAEDCDAQVRFQYSDPSVKRQRMDEIFNGAIEEGVRDFFIYCNSLSAAFDFDEYQIDKSREMGMEIRIYTPLQVYKKIGSQYDRVGALAANNLSSHKIEETLLSAHADMYLVGAGNMAIVNAIESGMAPAEIVSQFRLAELAEYMKASGCEALILGCTHFPYFKEELAAVTDLPLIDPAEEMFSAMIRNQA